MIIPTPPGAHIQQHVMVFSAGQKLPPTAVEIIPAELVVGRDGQPDIPELQQAAEQLGLGQLPTGTDLGDWFGQVGLGPGQSGELKVDPGCPGTLLGPGTLNGSMTLPGVDGIDVIQAGRQRLEFAAYSSPERHKGPGQYVTVTVDTTNRRPGDAFGFDVTSTDTGRRFTGHGARLRARHRGLAGHAWLPTGAPGRTRTCDLLLIRNW
jgi:hypothetical protein